MGIALIHYAIPFFLVTVGLESWLVRRKQRKDDDKVILAGHTLKDSLASLAMGVGFYWLHTELIGRLGWFEKIFNTPSHHRVHHGRNPLYLDRNHAGIFIIWDKVFGSFEPEGEPVDYGLTKNIHTYNPVKIAFHEWGAMLRDSWNAETWRGRLGYLFMPPGWSEDGSGKTAGVLRREALETASVGGE